MKKSLNFVDFIHLSQKEQERIICADITRGIVDSTMSKGALADAAAKYILRKRSADLAPLCGFTDVKSGKGADKQIEELSKSIRAHMESAASKLGKDAGKDFAGIAGVWCEVVVKDGDIQYADPESGRAVTFDKRARATAAVVGADGLVITKEKKYTIIERYDLKTALLNSRDDITAEMEGARIIGAGYNKEGKEKVVCIYRVPVHADITKVYQAYYKTVYRPEDASRAILSIMQAESLSRISAAYEHTSAYKS